MTIPRRHFIRNMGLIASGFLLSKLPASGGFQAAPHNIPVDKQLNATWLRSLSEQGMATTYLKSKNELTYIGMPVGGIGCGTLYLGGDGKLWLWDIFNENQEGIDPRQIPWPDALHDGAKVRSRDGANYIAPTVASEKRVLKQGFEVQYKSNGRVISKKLEESDWEEVRFEATYPVATITYIEHPLEIKMKAFSPFIPLDADNSGLPATILSFEIKNLGKEKLEVLLTGHMENGVGIASGNRGDRKNEMKRSAKNTSIVSTAAIAASARDAGTMCFSVMDPFASPAVTDNHDTQKSLIGLLGTTIPVAAGSTSSPLAFIISWHFKNTGTLEKLVTDATSGNYYSAKFKDAEAVTQYIVDNFTYLTTTTFAWQRTWYDSTLPWWFMERTFLNISCLATTTAHRFATGRFWAWEGVGACEGTCTHVWQYAQAMGRIFPSIEKDLRERVDLGVGFVEDSGMIWFRAENAKHPAIDGQAGTVLRFYREHQMSANDTFLRKNWPRIRKAITFILNQDKNKDGMEDTPLENTLDAVWDGEIARIVGLCIAAVSAGQKMAEEVNDHAFAAICGTYIAKGRKNMEEKLYNGEYFIHRPDAVLGRKKLGSYNTSHIDQVYGQAWAHQVGLGRVLDKQKTISALKALWKYNFTPDVGPYIKTHKGGRPYALAGEGGMIMNTNPLNEAKPYGESTTWQLGYFHECMSGFEHQVAAHMMAEGMVSEALVLTRAVHDRYHAAKRNPFNEIECSDHYARAMASYGTFITACGFEYHGPHHYISFAPRLSPEDFKAPFTAAEGWGAYSQQSSKAQFVAEFKLGYGNVDLKRIRLKPSFVVKKVAVTLNGKIVPATFKQVEDKVEISFSKVVSVKGTLGVKIS